MKKSILTLLTIIVILFSCKKDSDQQSDSFYKSKLEKSAGLKIISATELPKNLGARMLQFKSYEELYKNFTISESGETILKTMPSTDAKSSSVTTSLNTTPTTTVYYSAQIADVATASGSFGTISIGASYSMSAAAGFYPVSGNGWSVQILSTSATSPQLTYSGMGQIESGGAPTWQNGTGNASFLSQMQGYAQIAGSTVSFFITVRGRYTFVPPSNPNGVGTVTHSLSASAQ